MESNPPVLFSAPRQIAGPEDCDFYHTIEIPGLGLVHGPWDLREIVDLYLGGVSFADKRALEIGPASGFLTMEMEKRGATVVAVEVPDDPGWDFVPYPLAILDPIYAPRRHHMTRIKNSFWFTHSAYKSKAQLLYGDAYNLPDSLGAFDIAVMSALLLHCHSPLKIVEQCARRATTLLIADRLFPELEGRPVCRLAASRENKSWDTWWHFSTDFFTQFLRVMGFATKTITYTHEPHGTLFTIVAKKG